jgi:hypothetical protein
LNAAWRNDPIDGERRAIRLSELAQKALEKDRNRCYASVAEFAADVRRHLDNEAVLAGPPSLTYQLQ